MKISASYNFWALVYFQGAHISRVRALLFSERFYFCFPNTSQRLFFILLGMKHCPIFVSKQFLDHISLLFFGLF
jgi:hypothetical protein